MSEKHEKHHKKENGVRITTGTLIMIQTLLGIVIVFLLFSINGKLDDLNMAPQNNNNQGNAANPAAAQPKPTQAAPTPTPKVDVSIDDDDVKGNADAPVTIIEFSDFQCPYCGKFFTQTLPQIRKDYIDTGKVKMVYRDFPLSFHPNAQKAAEAAECAGEQKKFWEMHDKLFENQKDLSVENYKKWAGELGLNQDEFDTCLDSGKMAKETAKDMLDGQKAGVRGTPAFFINGKLVSGAQPYAVFKAAIDEALA